MRERRRKKMQAREMEAAAVLGLGQRQKTIVEDKKKVWFIIFLFKTPSSFFGGQAIVQYSINIYDSVMYFRLLIKHKSKLSH